MENTNQKICEDAVKLCLSRENSYTNGKDTEKPGERIKLMLQIKNESLYSAWIFTEEETKQVVHQAKFFKELIELPRGDASIYTLSHPHNSMASTKVNISSSHTHLVFTEDGPFLL